MLQAKKMNVRTSLAAIRPGLLSQENKQEGRAA